MHSVTLVLFCGLSSFSLVSSKHRIHYKNLRTGGDGDHAIEDDVGVDDDAVEILSGENNRNEGVDDDELSSNEDKNLSKGNDENDAVDDDDNGFAGNDKNNAVDDDDNDFAGNDKNDAVDDDDNSFAGDDKNDAINDDDYGVAGNDENNAVDDNANSSAANDENTAKSENDKEGGLFVEDDNDEPSALSSSHGNKVKLGSDMQEEYNQYQRELAAGDRSEFLGNDHHHEPRYYKDLSRRFVPVFPYVQRKIKQRKPSPEQILQFIMSSKKMLRNDEDTDIVPIKAPADTVVAYMKNGTEKYTSKPSEPTEEVIRHYMLRSGDYWDGVWKEDVKPHSILRTKKKKPQKQTMDIQPFTSKLVPGTKLYDLLAKIVKKSPKLLYFINN